MYELYIPGYQYCIGSQLGALSTGIVASSELNALNEGWMTSVQRAFEDLQDWIQPCRRTSLTKLGLKHKPNFPYSISRESEKTQLLFELLPDIQTAPANREHSKAFLRFQEQAKGLEDCPVLPDEGAFFNTTKMSKASVWQCFQAFQKRLCKGASNCAVFRNDNRLILPEKIHPAYYHKTIYSVLEERNQAGENVNEAILNSFRVREERNQGVRKVVQAFKNSLASKEVTVERWIAKATQELHDINDLEKKHVKLIEAITNISGVAVNYNEVDPRIDQLTEEITKAFKDKVHPLAIAAWTHQKLIGIHPFNEGNERFAQFVTNSILVGAGYKPLSFEDLETYRDAYHVGINHPGTFLFYIGRELSDLPFPSFCENFEASLRRDENTEGEASEMMEAYSA